MDTKELTVKIGEVSPDGLVVTLEVEGLREYYVHELNVTGLASSEGKALIHPVAYYTLNRIPKR